MSRIGEPLTTIWKRTAVLLRTLIPLSLALVVGGCAQDQRPSAGVAKTDCGLQQSYGGRDYVWINMEVHEVRSESRSAFSSLARPSDSEARAKAVELNRKLDALDQRAEERKAAAGECFGGKAAERYARTKQLIADQRKDTAEGVENTLAKNDVLEAERLAFERWQAENRNLLVRDLGDVKLEIVRIAKRDFFGRPAPNTAITVDATNTTTNKILKPRNQRVWGYQHGSDVGGMYSVGVVLRDSFGNEYKLTSISPPFLGDEAQGIRPGQTVSFEVRFGDVPLQHAESVHLIVESGTFGQASRVAFRLPSEAFYGTVANR